MHRIDLQFCFNIPPSYGGRFCFQPPVNASKTYFLYDGLVPVCELDNAGNVLATNTVGANGVLARRTGTMSVFYTFDPQGSVAQRLDGSGNVLSSHANEGFGMQVSTGSGYGSDPYAGYGGQWGYYRDSETGLHLLGHRYYDASSGRFLSRDPIHYQGGVNLYEYCGNGPLSGHDPIGLNGDIGFNLGDYWGLIMNCGSGIMTLIHQWTSGRGTLPDGALCSLGVS